MTESPDHVLVAGATGYIGGGVVRALHDAGIWVRALARDPSRLAHPEQCDDVFVGQATEPATLKGMCDGIDTVFSSIGIRSFARKPTLWEVDYEANINILDEAKAAGVRHFVFVSVVHAAEMARVSPIADARNRVAQMIVDSGMEYNIFEPTGLFNDMQEFVHAAQRRGVVRILGDGNGVINPLSAIDLGEEVMRVIRDRSLRNQIRPVGGRETFTHRQVARMAFRAVGKPPRIKSIPPWLIGLVARGVRPFNYNGYAVAKFFECIARTQDMRGQPVGRRRLEPFLHFVAEGQTASDAEASLSEE